MPRGRRIAILSLAQLVTSVAAGRLSARVPTRWLIGPGLLMAGIGFIVMAGLTGDSSWTHLIPGFILAGLGGGLVNPPLASTAIGVVPPAKAGMASGVSTTSRQVGIATCIAALGSIFTAAIQDHLAGALPSPLAGQAGKIVTAVHQGSAGQLLGSDARRQPCRRRRSAAVEFRHGAQRPALRHRGPAHRRRGLRRPADPLPGLLPSRR